jgi:hypothetical protein
MPNLFHKYQQPILIAVTLVIIAGFILFWNGSMISRGVLGGSDKVASVYGRTLTQADITRDFRKFQIASGLGLTELVQSLAGAAENQQQAEENYIFNSYIFDHEADLLQVYPTDQEVQDELAQVPGFQTDGKFDPAKLTEFVQERLPSLGFTDSVVDELVREQVRVRKVTALIGSTADVPPDELANRFQDENERMQLSVIRLNLSDLEKGVTVSDADAQQLYNARKDVLKSEEQRKVTIASFPLSPAAEQLKGKDRTDALQKLGDQAWGFAQAVVEKNASFTDQAKKFGAQLSTSGYFTNSHPDPALAAVPALAPNAFHLSPDYPSSDVIEGPNGYYVLHLEGSIPSQQLTFEQAKPGLIAQIQHDRASQLIQTKANEVRNQIQAALKAGKTFTDAATAAGLTADELPPFSLADVSKMDMPDKEEIIRNAVALPDGGISEFVQTEAGGLLVYMGGREPVGKIEAALGEAELKGQAQHQKDIATFVEWLRIRKESARLQMAQR